jgi:hypothetical protein
MTVGGHDFLQLHDCPPSFDWRFRHVDGARAPE